MNIAHFLSFEDFNFESSAGMYSIQNNIEVSRLVRRGFQERGDRTFFYKRIQGSDGARKAR